MRATFNVGQNHSNEVFTTTPAPKDSNFCPGTKPCVPGVLLPVWEPQVRFNINVIDFWESFMGF